MAGEIQLNGVTLATESGGTVTLTAGEANVGSNALVVDSNGNVGIGTTPAKKFTVSDSTGSNLFRLTGLSGYNLDINSVGIGNEFEFDIGSSSAAYSFNAAGTERMRIDSSGNVGIGTSSPSETLTVAQGTTERAIAVCSSDANVGGFIGTTGEADSTNKLVINGSRGSGAIIFQTISAERMRINSSGSLFVKNSGVSLGYNGSSYFSGEKGFVAYDGAGNNNVYLWVRDSNTDKVFNVEVGGSPTIYFTRGGNGYWDGTADNGPADYAEYFEWLDGNPNNEDRRGYSVVAETGKIRIATSSDNAEDIIGIISARPAIVGDTASLGWHKKYAVDEFGARLTRPINVYSWTSESGEEFEFREDRIPDDMTVPDNANIKIEYDEYYSDEYDPTIEYVPRSERPEWSPVGLLGKLRMRKGQPTSNRWIKLKDESDTIELWFVR